MPDGDRTHVGAMRAGRRRATDRVPTPARPACPMSVPDAQVATAGAMTTLRVMLVDDHALVRAAVRQAIDGADVELVAEAATAEDAFALALSVRPDVLLLDIDLPGMNGIQMLEELAPRLPETKIVMLTVSDSERDMLEAIGSGRGRLPDQGPQPGGAAARAAGHPAGRAGDVAPVRGPGHPPLRRGRATRARRVAGGGGVIEGLSPRENDVLRMLAEGLTDREIAAALIISPRTVETHVSNVLHKLNVRNRAEAAQRYRESG